MATFKQPIIVILFIVGMIVFIGIRLLKMDNEDARKKAKEKEYIDSINNLNSLINNTSHTTTDTQLIDSLKVIKITYRGWE